MVMLEGLKEAVQVGAGTTVTLPAQVLVPPALLATVKVQVWVAVGEKALDPVAPENVPFPRLPVQLYGIIPSASSLDVHERVEV